MELFYFFATLAVIFSLLVVFSSNPMHSIIFLIAVFFTFTVLYISLNAQFIAVVNFIVYMGAIMVLFLFVVMLLDLNKLNAFHVSKTQKGLGVATVFAFFLLLTVFLSNTFDTVGNELNTNNQLGSVKNLGKVLFTDFLYPFEISSILLLTAMVGAVLIAKKNEE